MMIHFQIWAKVPEYISLFDSLYVVVTGSGFFEPEILVPQTI